MGAEKNYPEYQASVCPDCLYASANGWDENTGRDLPDPAPLSNLPAGAILSTDEENLDAHFSSYPCDGCGSRLGGDRYHVTITEFGS